MYEVMHALSCMQFTVLFSLLLIFTLRSHLLDYGSSGKFKALVFFIQVGIHASI
jgi:hypothetical protein